LNITLEKRQDYCPYLLRNQTGMDLSFMTMDDHTPQVFFFFKKKKDIQVTKLHFFSKKKKKECWSKSRDWI